jgi:hypothetical protein
MFLKLSLVLFAMVNMLRAQIINGDFETGTPPWPANSICIQPWAWIEDTNPLLGIQWTNIDNGGIFPHGNWWVDLTGCGYGNQHWIEQKVPTTPNQKYTLGFKLGSWYGLTYTDAGAKVYINGGLIGRFANTTFSYHTANPLLWERFQFCFVATGNYTTIRFMGDGAPTSLTPGWAVITDSTGTGVIGLDSVTLDPGSIDTSFHFFASSPCVPSLLTLRSSSTGTSKWYFNDTLISTGPDTLNATVAGKYRLEFRTSDTCGIYIVDTLLINCDTCKIKMNARYFCVNDSTVFTFDPPDSCLNNNCIGQVQIDYGSGDGTIGNSPNGPARFSYQYHTPGIYTVNYCWFNNCTNQMVCDTMIITIVDCGDCSIIPNFTYDGCNPVHFTNTTLSNYHIISCNWDFGDGSGSTALNPVHAYASVPGTYVVCLTVVTAGPNGQTCKARVCITITVRPCDGGGAGGKKSAAGTQGGMNDNIALGIETLYFPNIQLFPNPSDGDVSIRGIPSDDADVTLSIFDISGRLLYEQTTRGAMKDVSLPTNKLDAGTYFVRIKDPYYNKEIKFIKE